MTQSEEWLKLVRAHPLATVVFVTAQGLEAHMLPLLVIEQPDSWYCLGHVAKNNKVWQSSDCEHSVLACFQGGDAYISPSYYPSKNHDHRVVPTWNYQSVHIHGRLSFVNDKSFKAEVLEQQVHHFEQQVGSDWQLRDAPNDFIDAMLNAIVGLKIKIERIEAHSKISQNQSLDNKLGALAGIANQERGQAQELVKAMTSIMNSSPDIKNT